MVTREIGRETLHPPAPRRPIYISIGDFPRSRFTPPNAAFRELALRRNRTSSGGSSRSLPNHLPSKWTVWMPFGEDGSRCSRL